MSLLHPTRPDTPHLTALHPRTAIPGAAFEITGTNLLAAAAGQLPHAFFGETAASFDLARPTRALIRVPAGAISSDLTLRYSANTSRAHTSNPLPASIGVPMVEDLHMISNPAVDAEGNLFAMVSGPRGEAVAVSIFRVARDLQVTPFVRGLMNVSALAFDRHGNLFASSRSEGNIYRITPAGAVSSFTEGMGIATGLAFDAAGNLFVGDRSGTIFKLSPSGEIFVFATLEPSVAFYHLCFRSDGMLLVTAPTTSSHQPIYAIDPDGNKTTFFHGLGRPQGMAFDSDDNLYVAASLQGQRGIVKIDPSGHAEFVVAGNDLVGLCFLDDGCVALATNSTIFHADIGIEGRPLV
jgi:outer membrane protein assembly factor BamB